jgi:hypothetical protein
VKWESNITLPAREKKERTNQTMERTEVMTALSIVNSERTLTGEGGGKDDSQGGKY